MYGSLYVTFLFTLSFFFYLGTSLALLFVSSAIVSVIIVILAILLVVGVVLLVKLRRKSNKQQLQTVRDTELIHYQGNVTEKFHVDGEQQLHMANCHQQQSLTDTTTTENLNHTAAE